MIKIKTYISTKRKIAGSNLKNAIKKGDSVLEIMFNEEDISRSNDGSMCLRIHQYLLMDVQKKIEIMKKEKDK